MLWLAHKYFNFLELYRFRCKTTLLYELDELQQTGQILDRVFNFRSDHLDSAHLCCYQVKLPKLKLKTRPKELRGSLPLNIALPGGLHVLGKWVEINIS